MVPRDHQELSALRAARARELAGRYPAAGEVLAFYAELAAFQGQVLPRAPGLEALIEFRGPLVDLVRRRGTPALREAALVFEEAVCRRALEDYWNQRQTESLQSFFARVLLQPYAAAIDWEPRAGAAHRCPRCGHRPQVGVLRPLGEGSALSLACSLCLGEWPFRRGACAGCGEEAAGGSLAYYSAPGFDHLQLQACDRCRAYLHTVDLARDPGAVPEVDELAALPLDVWAREQGYRKVQANLAGI